MLHGRYALLSILALASSGCLLSDAPLIGETESVTPIAPGTYVSVEDGDELVVTHSSTTTRVTGTRHPDDPDDLRFAALGSEYYIVMSKYHDAYLYRLVRNEGARFTLYGVNDDECDRLRALWLSDGKTPAEVGIVSITGEEHYLHCRFARYDDLARAFRALLENGGLEPDAVFARK